MSKIAILLPKEYMLEQARNVIREDELDIDILKVIKTSDSVYEARQAVEQGAEVVLARGVQAAFIRQYTNIPVAELTLTGQEIGLMIASAKKKVPDKKCPQIALIGFKNMFSDTTYADELHSYYLKGYVAYAHFSDIRITGKEMEYCVELSKMYALSKNPVLICGEDGTDKEKLAQCIHNNSSYKAGPFVAVNCSGMTEQMQVDRLFGNPDAEDESMKKGALAIGDHGTIVISEIEKLSLLCQYRLYRAIRYDSLIQNDLERSQTLDNRIIAITGADLYQYVEQGRFRQDLYYLLNSLTVEIPPLRKRPQDIRAIVEDCRVRFTKRYARFPKIAEDAMEALAGFGWQGNEIQLESFCERLFLTSPKKTITSDYVYFLLDTLYPVKERISEDGTTVIYQHPEAARLTELLEKHQGNRSAVAKELGISTTTLWRRMKKYGVINKYDLT